MPDSRYDLFICHAWEDKAFVRPLAESLHALGLRVWYDEFVLRVGDSLLQSIDRGLAGSRHGIVVLSKAFFQKEIPQHELRGLLTRQLHEGRKLILPIWHGVTKEDVLGFSPPLADALALRTSDMAAEDIGLAVLAKVRPDIYERYRRDDLLKLYKSQPLHELHEELVRLREELSGFQCPHCGALMVEHAVLGYDVDEVERTVYECGYQLENTEVERACPHDPELPEFGEFELEYSQNTDGSWFAFGKARTKKAKRFGRSLHMYPYGEGKTKGHAARLVYATYLQKVRPREWQVLQKDLRKWHQMLEGPDDSVAASPC